MKYQGQSTDELEEPGEFLETFDLLDENDDEQPDRRPLEPMEDFDIVSEDTDEQCDAHRTAQEAHASVSAPVQPPMNDNYHHGMRVRALHMKTVWHDVVTGEDDLAVRASLMDKSTIICRTGMLMLSSGTGAWRVRDTMNRVAQVLGVTIHVDLSLLSFECTCIEGHHCFSEVVSLPTTGVNTHRIWMMENFLREIETYGRRFTVREYHEMLETVEHSKPDYSAAQQGLAAGCACGAFVFCWAAALSRCFAPLQAPCLEIMSALPC